MAERCERQNLKWYVENFNGKKDIKVDPTAHKQSVYIYNCQDSVITISAKVSQITVDKCKKCGIIFDTVIASVDIVNSDKMQLQMNSTVPSVAIDKCNAVTLYVQTKAGRAVEIVTSASTEVNVTTAAEDQNSDAVEQAVPEQFRSTFTDDGKLVTNPVDHI